MSAQSVGEIGLDLVINKKDFERQMGGIQKLAKNVGKALAAAFTVKSVAGFGRECLKLGSDLAEVQNVVDVTFPAMSKQVDEFAQGAAEAFGLSETMSKKFTGTFGAMAKAFGFTERQAYDMGTALTGLAGDVASFYNIGQDEAYTKLKSVFTGETESLKDLGIVMTQTALDSYALANGFGKTTAKMTEAEKVALRYKFVQEQLAGAAGDFARTSGGWANQIRILSLQFDSLKASIGQGLINLLTPAIKLVNVLVGKLRILADTFRGFTELVAGRRGSGMAGDMDSMAQAAGKAVAAVEGVGDAAASSAKKAKGALAGFDALQTLPEKDETEGSGASAGGGAVSFGAADMGAAQEAESRLDGLLGKWKELAGLFAQGFGIGLGDGKGKLDSVRESIGGIRESLKGLFADSSVKEAAEGLFSSFTTNAGKVTGSLSEIGLTAADMLLGGFDGYLQNNEGYIKERLVSIFDVSGEIADLAGNLSVTLAEIFEVFGGDSAKGCTESLFGIFADSFLGIREMSLRLGRDVMSCIAEPVMENKDGIGAALEGTLAPLAGALGTLHELMQNTFQKVFQAYEEYVEPAFDSISGGLSTVFAGALEAYNSYLAPVLGWVSERFSLLVSEYIQPLIDAFVEFGGKAVGALSMLWDFLSPFVSWFVEKLVAQISSGIEWMWTKVEYMVGVLSAAVKGIIDVCSGLIDFVVGVFTGDWDKAWNGIRDIFDSVGNAIKGIFRAVGNLISDIFTAITDTADRALSLLKSIVDKVLNAVSSIFGDSFGSIKNMVFSVFTAVTGKVESALALMKGVVTRSLNSIATVFKNIFSGIWNVIRNTINSILGGVESMANGLIRGINGMISALNAIHVDIPEWIPGLGGKSFGISLPELSEVSVPRLAQGGYVKPNAPQLAMIGDNRHQGEIVAPEDKIYQVSAKAMWDVMQKFLTAMRAMGTPQGGGTTVVLKVTGEMAPFVRLLKIELDKEAGRSGINFEVVYE